MDEYNLKIENEQNTIFGLEDKISKIEKSNK